MKLKMTFVILAVGLALSACSDRYVPEIKAAAPEVIRQAGFTIVGYEGYQWGAFDTFGGKVWYTFKRNPDNGIIYHGAVVKWGNEYHLYNLTAIDAIKP